MDGIIIEYHCSESIDRSGIVDIIYYFIYVASDLIRWVLVKRVSRLSRPENARCFERDNVRALREFSARTIIPHACASCEFISRANE